MGFQPAEPPPPPNIVLFLVDDMGWQDTSVAFHTERTPFNDFFRTPAMEQLARDGVCFTQAYSCAVCTPTRVSLLTGQNAARHHVTNWTLQGETGGKSAQLGPPAWKREGFQPGDAPTLPGLLRDRGYRTIHVGKAHWGAVGTQGSDPCNLGFDVNIAGHAAGAPESFQGEDRYGEGKAGKEVWAVPGLQAYKGTATHLTDALTAEACRELGVAVRMGQPFYLHMAHYAVHAPLQPHRPYDEHYRDAAVDRSERDYASMVEGMDHSLGVLRQHLVDLGVASNTLIVFYADNGGVTHAIRGKNIRGTGKDTHNLPLREGKGSAYEGGIRVPAIVSWAEVDRLAAAQGRLPVAQGARCAQPILIEDWFPTLLGVAGAAVPASAIVDGQDFAVCLGEPGRAERSAPMVWHFPNVWTPQPKGSRSGYRPHSVIRIGDWKAIYFYEEERWELYDLAHDLAEQRDLVAQEPQRLRQLAAELQTRLVAAAAPWPVDLATGEPRVLTLPKQ
jgi:arylsulfatase A-like enzyme